MAKNNVQNIKFLRNGTVFGPSNDKTARQVALDAMNEQLNSLADGTAILGRYKETNGVVKTLVGFAYISDDAKTLTVFDVDGASANVDAKILAAIQALDAEITSSGGKNVQVKVTETDGKITAVNITTDSTVNSNDVNTAITNAINELDGSVVAESGFYVKSVTEVDGKISGTTEALPSLEEVKEIGKPIVAVSENKGQVAASAGTINAEYVNVTGSVFTSSTVQAALEEINTAYKTADTAIIGGASSSANTLGAIEGIINQIKTDEKTYTIEAITNGLASNVRKAYKLVDEDGKQSGATIEIYKDSSLQSVKLVNEDPTQKPAKEGQFLKFTYITDSGTTDVVYLDVSTFLVEAEFKDGLQTNNGEVSIKLDTTGDDTGDGKFLTVGANGLKLDGVTDAIGTAIGGLAVSDSAVAGQYVSQVSETDGKIAVIRTNVSEAVLNNYSKGSDSGSVTSTDTINQAISKLEVRLDGELAELGADVSGNSTHVTVGVKEENGKVTAVTVSESNIANAVDLSSEIEARKAVDGQDGQTYVANSGKKFISGATSLNGADVALNDALENVDSKYVSGVTVNGKAVTVSNHVAPISISATNGTGSDTAAIVVNTADNGEVTLQINYIDAGVYDAN